IPHLHRTRVEVRAALTEGSPVAVMEAMACGRPILATRVGGTGDLILDGETGMHLEPRNVEALANGLIRVLTDRQHAAAMGRRAREWAEQQMTWERVSRTYEQIYEEVAS